MSVIYDVYCSKCDEWLGLNREDNLGQAESIIENFEELAKIYPIVRVASKWPEASLSDLELAAKFANAHRFSGCGPICILDTTS